jgi:lipopolysaccharide export system protein LptA
MQHFKNKIIVFVLQLLSVLMFSDSTLAQPVFDTTASIPLTITSQTMTVNNKLNTATFDYDVVIKKGDLIITSEHVEIISKKDHSLAVPDSAFKRGSIAQLRAWGNVKMYDGTRRAQAHEALYDQENEAVTLTGEPILFEETYQVTGTKMTFYIKDNRSIIESSKVLIQAQETNNLLEE